MPDGLGIVDCDCLADKNKDEMIDQHGKIDKNWRYADRVHNRKDLDHGGCQRDKEEATHPAESPDQNKESEVCRARRDGQRDVSDGKRQYWLAAAA